MRHPLSQSLQRMAQGMPIPAASSVPNHSLPQAPCWFKSISSHAPELSFCFGLGGRCYMKQSSTEFPFFQL